MGGALRVRWTLLFIVTLFVLGANIAITLLGRGPWTTIPAQALAIILLGLSGYVFYGLVHREIEQRQVLLTISQGILSRTELGDLLDYIVQSILRLVPLADKCVVHLLDEPGRRLYPRHSSVPVGDQSFGIPVDQGIAGRALRELRTQIVANVHASPEFLPLQSSQDLRSMIVAPLHAEGQPLGTISINSRLADAFDQRDEWLVTTLAAQASSAIYQAQLYAQALRDTHYVEAIINTLADGLLVLDAERRVVRYNPALAHLLGADATEMIGQPVDPASESPAVRRLAAFLREGHDQRASDEYQVEIEEPLHALIRVNASPAPDQQGNWGQIIVLHDETEEMGVLRAKASYIAAATRELAPPLEAIRGYATLLLNTPSAPDGDRRQQWAGEIRGQSARVMRLLGDLVDLSALDAGRLEAQPELTDLAALVREALDEIEEEARDKGLTIGLDSPPNLPALRVDAERVRHVLLHLLQNAVHRAERGGFIQVTIEITIEDVTVTLADNGRAIPPEAQARILQGHYRVNGATPQDPVGTGLGLYISRRLLEALGGHLWMPENEEGAVAFRFLLPTGD